MNNAVVTTEYQQHQTPREVKSAFSSTTIIGLVVVTIGFVLHLLSYAGVLNDALYELIVKYIGLILEAAGIPVAAYGRIKSNGEKIVFGRVVES